jgi:hypothetical protein
MTRLTFALTILAAFALPAVAQPLPCPRVGNV